MAGTVTGLDLTEALVALPAGLDRDLAVLLLTRAEIAMLSAQAEKEAETTPPA